MLPLVEFYLRWDRGDLMIRCHTSPILLRVSKIRTFTHASEYKLFHMKHVHFKPVLRFSFDVNFTYFILYPSPEPEARFSDMKRKQKETDL